MQVHHKNFGSKTSLRCGFLDGIYTFPEHIHQFPEIVYVKDGELEITVDGKTEIMHAGDIAVIAPFRAHSFYTPEYVNRWVAVFSNDFIANFITNDELFSTGETNVFHASEGLLAFFESHLIDSEELFFDLSDETIRTFRAVVFAVYEEYLRTIPRATAKVKHKALVSILSYIGENYYMNDITLHTIGEALGYSPKYISLCLGDVDELNLSYLINSFRCEHAKNLLASTKSRMIDIAIDSGFATERSFYRAFQKLTGLTPGEYRKSRRTKQTQENEADFYPKLHSQKLEKKHKARSTERA